MALPALRQQDGPVPHDLLVRLFQTGQTLVAQTRHGFRQTPHLLQEPAQATPPCIQCSQFAADVPAVG